MSISSLITAGTNVVGRASLVVVKHSPTILTVAGVTGMVTAAVLGAKATLKAEGLADELKADLDLIKHAEDQKKDIYTAKDASKDRMLAYSKSFGAYTRLYGPAVTLGVVSIISILVGHNILHKRNLAVVAAYKTLEEGFAKYRDRVRAEVGETRELELRHAVETVEETDEKGKKTKVKRVIDRDGSIYARYFAEGETTNWQEDHEYNLLFLSAQMRYQNDRLAARGHLFLNEVYEALGFPHTPEGAVVGWVSDERNGDGRVDYGIFGPDANERMHRFASGDDKSLLLDFNVDGLIWDKI